MTTLEKIRAEIEQLKTKPLPFDGYDECVKYALQIIDKYAEEPIDEWQNGYDRAWEEAEVFYEKEPCDDVVSRQAVYEILEGNWNTDFLRAEVEKLSSVRPQEPKTGHWIMHRKLERRTCDNCNKEYRWSFYPHNYCPNCGAKMVEPQESEDKE